MRTRLFRITMKWVANLDVQSLVEFVRRAACPPALSYSVERMPVCM